MAAQKPVFTVWPPRIRSIESLELALAELGRIDAFGQFVDAKASQAALKVREEYRDGLLVTIGEKKEMPLAEWKAALEAAIEESATEFRDNWLDDGKKSREFVHGTIGWRNRRPALDPMEGFTAAGKPAPLDFIVEFLRGALRKCSELVGATAARFIDVKVAYRKADILKAFNDGELSRADLKKIGFEPRGGGETFFIDLKAEQLAEAGAR